MVDSGSVIEAMKSGRTRYIFFAAIDRILKDGGTT